MKKHDFIKVSIKSLANGELAEDLKGVVIVGRHSFHKALDESFLKHKVGDSYSLDLPVDKAFGSRQRGLIRMIPSRYFKQNQLNPVKGLVVNVDGLVGKVISASPGRVMVDFNHPMAGKDVVYEVKIEKLVTDSVVKVKELVKSLLGSELSVVKSAGNIVIKDTIGLPKSIKEHVESELIKVLGKSLASKVKFEERK